MAYLIAEIVLSSAISEDSCSAFLEHAGVSLNFGPRFRRFNAALPMIDLTLYRQRIGCYRGYSVGRKKRARGVGGGSGGVNYSHVPPFSTCFRGVNTRSKLIEELVIRSPQYYTNQKFMFGLYFYFMSLFFVVTSMILLAQKSTVVKNIFPGVLDLNIKLSLMAMVHIKVGYFCLLSAGIFKCFIKKCRSTRK